MTQYFMRFLSGLILAAIIGTSWAANETLQVKEPWVREGPPTARALAGYMVLHNASNHDRALVGASSPAFGSVQLHRTITEDGVAKMVHQLSIVVPASGSVTFEPNGYHLMLMGPKQALRAGDKVEITLEFSDGTTLPVGFDVRAADSAKAMSHGSMEHSHMSHQH